METWLIVLLVVLAIAALSAAGAVYYVKRKSAKAVTPLGYVSGGANYMITQGIGVPAEISAFILLGLASNPGGIPPVTGKNKNQGTPWFYYAGR